MNRVLRAVVIGIAVILFLAWYEANKIINSAATAEEVLI